MNNIQNKLRIFKIDCNIDSIAMILFSLVYINHFIKSPDCTFGIGSIPIASIMISVIYLACIIELSIYTEFLKLKESKGNKRNTRSERSSLALVFLISFIAELVYSVISCVKLYTFIFDYGFIKIVLYILCIIISNIIYAKLLKNIINAFNVLTKEEKSWLE